MNDDELLRDYAREENDPAHMADYIVSHPAAVGERLGAYKGPVAAAIQTAIELAVAAERARLRVACEAALIDALQVTTPDGSLLPATEIIGRTFAPLQEDV